MKTLQQLGTDLGKLVEEKNAAYGSSFVVAGDFLRLLFPGGIPANRYDDALVLVRIFDKQMRIATDKDAFGESPYQDIAGYGLLGLQLHQQRKDSTTWPGTASDAARTQSKAQPGSALPSIDAKTIMSASAKTASEPSPQPASSSAPCAAASAPTATEAANASVAVRPKRLIHSAATWQLRRGANQCIFCEGGVFNVWNSIPVLCNGTQKMFYCCSRLCEEIVAKLIANGEVAGVLLP
ncbi:MAG: hypothetical protein J0G35_01505 [Acidobacteriales bacterium]|nr:hypothetical protein [Terriglobales bacterium]